MKAKFSSALFFLLGALFVSDHYGAASDRIFLTVVSVLFEAQTRSALEGKFTSRGFISSDKGRIERAESFAMTPISNR